MRRFFAFFVIFSVLMGKSWAMDTIAREAILIDVDTRAVLFEKNSQTRMPTSSMSKVMTMYMVFNAVKEGRLKLEDTLTVSEKAWRMQGSKMFVPINEQVKVEDLIRGVIVQSGNDATIVLAEGVAGSEEAFAQSMNAQAQKLGMKNSNFMNASGWPDPNHYSTAYDLALLGYHMIKDHGDLYHYYSEKEFTYNGIKQGNRNPLLYKNIGADGIKTGHAEEAGYGLIGSAVQNGRRLILVINGLNDMQERADESARLMSWGFTNFQHLNLYKAGDVVEKAAVWLGDAPTVPVTVKDDVKVLYKIDEKEKLSVTAVINEPVQAPVAKDTEVGVLKIKMGNFPERSVPLYAAADVGEMPLLERMMVRAKTIFGGSAHE